MLEQKNTAGRVNCLHTVYAEIARTNGNQCMSVRKELKCAKENDDEAAYHDGEKRMTKHAVVCIVFAALSLEALIYDFAARYFDDKYVVEHLDKLDLVSKWLVIPRLVCGSEFDKSAQPYGHLKELVSARNSLVHHKSSGWSRNSDGEIDINATFARGVKNENGIIRGMEAALSALDKVPEKLFLMTNDDFVFISLPKEKRNKHRIFTIQHK